VVEEITGVQDSLSLGFSSAYLQRNHSDPIRVGVIGVGNMGQHHTRILSMLKDVELVGVADVNVERGIDTTR
jgi:predicted homoserine dehydrogenase-like protein